MSDLQDLVPSIQRAVAPPGEFATYFPNSTDNDLAALAADAFAEAQLDGFFASGTLDVDALTVTPDITPGEGALVVLYAAARVLSTQLANIKTSTKYKAGPVEAETQQAASVLAALLTAAVTRKKEVLEAARAGNLAKAFGMIDMYVARDLRDPLGIAFQGYSERYF